MPPTSPQDERSIRAPHPLALRLIERLHAGSRVLDFASGSGRNTAALARAGLDVVAVDDATAQSAEPLRGVSGRFAGTLSTHGFLHGSEIQIAQRVRAVVEQLDPRGVFYATFGSSSDDRFGRGTALDRNTYAPTDGDEAGVPHTFFTTHTLRAFLEPLVVIELLSESVVDEIAGRWAHERAPLEHAVHWFVTGYRPMRGR